MTAFARRFFWIAAWVTVLGWIVWLALLVVRSRGVAEGVDLPWLADNGAVTLTVNAIAAVGMLTCWMGSIVVWARSNRRGVVHGVALIGLLFFGLFVGALYILAALRTVPEVAPDEAAD